MGSSRDKPFDITSYGIQLHILNLVIFLHRQEYKILKKLDKEDIIKCDHAVKILRLDKGVERYYSSSRLDYENKVYEFTVTRKDLISEN